MITALTLPPALAAQIAQEARAAFPRECCGLIEGTRAEDQVTALAAHPVKNLSVEADRFELDPAAHLHLMRLAREAGRAIIGCYHSHPNGMAKPSETDSKGADEADFLWLIAGVTLDAVTLAVFVWTPKGFAPVIRQ